VILAPATADLLARISHGHADDLLTACLLAAECPVLVVPAMNDRMWANVHTQRNVEQLRMDGFSILEPDTGPLAAGEGTGPGRMPEPETILSHAARLLEQDRSLSGRRIVVTAGATREPIDPVRFISNHSTGLMGSSIAAAAWRRGADVTLIVGHTDVPVPPGPSVVKTTTTESMADAVHEAFTPADALIMAAAPADFAPSQRAAGKVPKGDLEGEVKLVPTIDILQSVVAGKGSRIVVGFALETGNAVEKGAGKLAAKGLDLIVVNDQTEPGAGFGGETNRVTIVARDGSREALPLMLKSDVADAILDRVALLLDGR
jgi:phosphopantothenoylcysteine decarboxylase / phosphopantothenate---cysteine ligase